MNGAKFERERPFCVVKTKMALLWKQNCKYSLFISPEFLSSIAYTQSSKQTQKTPYDHTVYKITALKLKRHAPSEWYHQWLTIAYKSHNYRLFILFSNRFLTNDRMFIIFIYSKYTNCNYQRCHVAYTLPFPMCVAINIMWELRAHQRLFWDNSNPHESACENP